jgi:hypothetical protein
VEFFLSYAFGFPEQGFTDAPVLGGSFLPLV